MVISFTESEATDIYSATMKTSEHLFLQLAKEIFPRYMVTLLEVIKKPIAARRVWERIESNSRGCYVFIENGKPIYVGISKHIRTRLRQHLTARSHNDSSFVYKMAKELEPGITHYRKTPNAPEYQRPFQLALERLSKCDVAWVSIRDALEVYLFEPYACIELGTSDYNSFETH